MSVQPAPADSGTAAARRALLPGAGEPNDRNVTLSMTGPRRDRGSALLLVVAATAGLGVMATMLLLSARVAYEIAGVRAEALQAEALAEGAVRQAVAGLGSGTVPLPSAERPVRVVNGVAEGGQRMPVARFPPPPGHAAWPALSASADDQPVGGGHGAEIEIAVATGPRGEPRSRVPGGDGLLLKVTARAWFRGARSERRASLLWVAGVVRRLD